MPRRSTSPASVRASPRQHASTRALAANSSPAVKHTGLLTSPKVRHKQNIKAADPTTIPTDALVLVGVALFCYALNAKGLLEHSLDTARVPPEWFFVAAAASTPHVMYYFIWTRPKQFMGLCTQLRQDGHLTAGA